MKRPSDRYVQVVEWSDEDKSYAGRAPGLMLGGVHGRNERKVFDELCQAIDEWVEVEQREHLSMAAERQGLSLNQYGQRLLTNR